MDGSANKGKVEEDLSSECVSSSDLSSCNSVDSSSSEFMEDVTSSSYSFLSSASSSSSSFKSPLYKMSDLLVDLPIKRGLSKHFQGKSQSFTSLSKVMCLEELAKPERPCLKKNKLAKPCKSHMSCTKTISKNNHQPKSHSLAKRHVGLLGTMTKARPPPVPPHGSTTFSAAHTKPLFA